ncbi:hypothetical protein [Myroides phaeus]|uniref:Uncharacterized protein n=1 Tax=Myroides phaeus TaxID=702745 RepID=A0A1G8GGR3_9FLAO|nr:hypothetical protein [Myroides phaeus]MEC4117693.1 hypothetical protein [Myroides phaeus]SDH93578.1 hypothetical protein SAMN05421818_12712 [Myroides phaeus]
MKTRLMFDFARTVLENVSFDPKLFYKELQKAINHLLPYDLDQLEQWVSGYVQEKPELHDSLSLINS